MVSIVDPAADVLWDSVGTILPEERVVEWYPKTHEAHEEWAAVRNSAVTIMESGNLLTIGERARDNGAWMELSRGMTESGAAAFAASESKDPDAVFWIDDKDRGRIRDTAKSRGN